MATDGPVSRFNSVEYSGSDERLLHAALLQRAGSGAFAARTGRRPGGAAPTASGLTITVPADAGVIYDASLGGGPWLWALPSSKAVTLDERPGPGTSRIDVIVGRINDVEGDRGLKIEIIKGQEAGAPSKPDLPARSCELLMATVPASGPITLVASTIRTVAAGGILPVATDTERDALPSPHVGFGVYNEQRSRVEFWDGVRFAPASGPSARRIFRRSEAIPNLAAGTNVPITQALELEPGDMGNDCGITLSGGVATISRPGLYWLMARWVVGGATSTWTVGFFKNGARARGFDMESSGDTGITYCGHVPLETGDTIQPFLRQMNSASSSRPIAVTEQQRFEIKYDGPLL